MMVQIALLGNGSKDKFTSVVLEILHPVTPYLYLSNFGYDSSHRELSDKTLLIADCDETTFHRLRYDMILVKDGFSSDLNQILSNNAFSGSVLFNPDSFRNFLCANDAAIPVSYGLSEKNTVTVSSIDTDMITLTVQRELSGIGNRKIEPQDIIIKTAVDQSNLNPYMAAGIVSKLLFG